MANPRKFSEKIAIHVNRMAEETAAFEKIMQEVKEAKVASPRALSSSSKNTLRISYPGQSLGEFRGGSLPDVSAPRSEEHVILLATISTVNSIGDVAKTTDEPGPYRVRLGSASAGARQSRTRSPGAGPIRSSRERKPSPYSGPYLSPPADTGWRRTNSDSALHQSAMQGGGMDRNDQGNRMPWDPWAQNFNGPDRNSNGRPRSSCEIPRVPGINIYPSVHDPNMVQIPIGNNTGSLPDLTNVDFTSPIHVPLDQDHDNSGSPYSISPNTTSPSTLSPTNALPGMRPHGRFNFTPPISHPNHLPVPSNSRYRHLNYMENAPLDKSIGVGDTTDFSQIGGMGGIYQQPHSPSSPSPTLHQLQNDGYRSPRPSPQSSPSLGGRHSAPCSPGAPSPNDYHLQHQNMPFQQHFEQLTVDWAQLVASLMGSSCSWSAQLETDSPVGNISYVDPPTSSPQLTHPHSPNMPEAPSDGGYYSTSPSQQLVYPSTSPRLQNTTPNTPTSLPEITLTDFSAGQDFSRQLENDFFTDDQLKEGLTSLDSTDFQIFNSGMPEILEIDDYRS